jgi:hypothetical protein
MRIIKNKLLSLLYMLEYAKIRKTYNNIIYDKNLSVLIIPDKNIKLNNDFKNKFIIDKNMTSIQFLMVVRARFLMKDTDGIFLFKHNSSIVGNNTMSDVHAKYKDIDDILRLNLSIEPCFG